VNLRIDPAHLFLELVPLTIQIAGMGILLWFTRADIVLTLFAILACLVWLKVSKDKLLDELNEMRVDRSLFTTLGNWVGAPKAAEEYDRIRAEYSLIEPSVVDESYSGIAKAGALTNTCRSTVSFLLHFYLMYAVLSEFIGDVTLPSWLVWIGFGFGGLIAFGVANFLYETIQSKFKGLLGAILSVLFGLTLIFGLMFAFD
jgi:hypothetical protein